MKVLCSGFKDDGSCLGCYMGKPHSQLHCKKNRHGDTVQVCTHTKRNCVCVPYIKVDNVK